MDYRHCAGYPELSSVPASDADAESVLLPAASSPAADPADPSSSWRPGKLIAGMYEVIKPLGQGGMAEVFLLRDSRTGTFVAAKRPIGPFIQIASLREQFVDEANAWTRLAAHPHIVNAFDAREVDYFPCIIMEYVDGGTLQDALRDTEHNVPFEDVLRIGAQICWAVEFAHEQGLVHRDLKPSNILLASTGDAKVTDFGLVADIQNEGLGAAAEHPQASAVGTWAYMAPEQWDGAASPAVDIYALGVLLYFALTGHHPLAHGASGHPAHLGHGREAAEAYRQLHRAVQPRDPRELDPNIAPELRDLLLSCLSKDPDARPDGLGSVADVLARLYQRAFPESAELRKPTAIELDDEQQSARAWALTRVGTGAQTRGDLDMALKQYHEAEQLFGSLGSLSGLCTCYNLIGSIRHQRSEFDEALSNYQMSLDLVGDGEPHACLANTWIGIGNTYWGQGTYQKSLDAYERGYELSERLGYSFGMAKCRQNQGAVLRSIGELDAALMMQEDSLRAYADLGDVHQSAVVRMNIGEIRQAKGQYEEALALLREALPVLEQLGSRYYAALCYLNTGEVVLKLGDANQALTWYARSAETLERLGCRHELAECLVYIAEAYENLALWSPALAAYRRAESLKRELGQEVPASVLDRIRMLCSV